MTRHRVLHVSFAFVPMVIAVDIVTKRLPAGVAQHAYAGQPRNEGSGLVR